MDVKKLVLLVGALVIAAVTAVMAKNMFTGAAAPQVQATPMAPPPKEGPEVLVATGSLPIGTIIGPESLKYQPWPEGLVQPAYFIKGQPGGDPSSLLGTVVRTEITAGQPLTQGALIKPGERGFLAAALGPGMRAITVRVDPLTGVAGFVFPGDRVDLLLTQTVAGAGNGDPLRVAETIIRNVRVLAADQRTNSVNAEGKPDVRVSSSVTLEVTPRIAEKIIVAQSVGGLSLALRSIADNSQQLEDALATGEAKGVDGEGKAPARIAVSVQSEPTDERSSFSVGGDVSRFQRRTVPKADVPTGPFVKVARGTAAESVPVGAK